MKLAIAADKSGEKLKVKIEKIMENHNYSVQDVSESDIFEATMNVVKAIEDKAADRGIVIDAYGVAPFMIANKNSEIICAPVYEDYTSKMTRMHNRTQIITLGANITAEELSCCLALNFATAEYDGGRHQVRIDMLNRML
ncbi:hypothetical protein P22_1068 [Propionispora sp. 2/2-37]|uniref:RpiB/LacA/LacB family sugar-phosphate isomerase n=1 Tax=Propionispora sp. 2/2-37 TaxID=1677858 RepID=UPI0006BB6FA9|nr:RpiB/LacA/LacB family sugar-phosphate isomerase [Propionispora sp. 2/2-37]CUH94999.1 hypothetical protein P22_1068 [Propionispora sp. 2/2-37]